jgi:hypothetical protein
MDLLTKLAEALLTAIGGILGAWILARVRSGRLSQTFDQAKKVGEIVDSYSTTMERLSKIPEAQRSDAETLMLNSLKAVRDDLDAERIILADFEKKTAAVRDAFFLYLPSRKILLVPLIGFHTLVLFALYIIVHRIVHGGWQVFDLLAIGVALAIAALVRLSVGTISPSGR